MNARMIRKDGLEIATEGFGNPLDPPALLIMGGMASMLWWPDRFCEQLAAQRLYVVRYDHRDTGLSTKYPPGRHPIRLTTSPTTRCACSTDTSFLPLTSLGCPSAE